MKVIFKSILAAAVLATVIPAKAEIIDTGKKFEGSMRFLFQKFMSNHDLQVMSSIGDDETEAYTFSIYDKNFDEVLTFSTPAYPTVSSQYTVSYVLDGPTDIYVGSINDSPWVEPITKDNFIQQCAEMGYTRVETQDGEVWCLSDELGRYYHYDIYEFKYPESFYVWKDGSSYYRYINYEYRDWGPTGIYGEERSEEDYGTPYPLTIYPYDGECVDYDGMKLTQTLFNKDDLFEWIVPIYEKINCSYVNDREKVEGERVFRTGFRVESQNGSIVAEVKSPANFAFDSSVDVFIMGEKHYLILEMYKLGGNEYYNAIYEIDADNASVKMVGAPRRVSVDPTTPRQGTLVNVDLGNPVTEACKVVVTSTSGKTVMTQSLEPGSMGTTIDTARFERGMYIVTVTDGKTTHENTKIIIR